MRLHGIAVWMYARRDMQDPLTCLTAQTSQSFLFTQQANLAYLLL